MQTTHSNGTDQYYSIRLGLYVRTSSKLAVYLELTMNTERRSIFMFAYSAFVSSQEVLRSDAAHN